MASNSKDNDTILDILVDKFENGELKPGEYTISELIESAPYYSWVDNKLGAENFSAFYTELNAIYSRFKCENHQIGPCLTSLQEIVKLREQLDEVSTELELLLHKQRGLLETLSNVEKSFGPIINHLREDEKNSLLATYKGKFPDRDLLHDSYDSCKTY
jgi:Asp-tRNA(Asn)/Glu-tRNA(Gln) amidotransferase C subunit